MKEDIHVEVSISGLSKDVFGSMMSWIWEVVQPLFPVITGQWSLAETALIAATIALLLMLCDGFRHLARKLREDEAAATAPDTAKVYGHGSTADVKSLQSLHLGQPHTAAAVVPASSGAATAKITRTAPFVVPLVCRPLGFLCRMALYYIVICLLIRLWPEVWAVLFGIGA